MHMYCIWIWGLGWVLRFIHNICAHSAWDFYSAMLHKSAVFLRYIVLLSAKVTTYNEKVRTAASCSLPAIAWLSCLESQDKAETSDFYIGVHPESLYHCVRIWRPQPQIWVCVIWANSRLSTKSPVSPHAFHSCSHWGSCSCSAMSQPRC